MKQSQEKELIQGNFQKCYESVKSDYLEQEQTLE